MDLDIDIIRNTDCEVDDDFLRAVVEKTVARSGRPSFTVAGRLSLSIVLTDDEEIRDFNLRHREKDATTDILSFPMSESGTPEPGPDGDCPLGDLIVSVPFILRSAEEDGVTFRREFSYILSHGVLHLLGYEHSDGMFSIQDVVTDILAGGEDVRRGV